MSFLKRKINQLFELLRKPYSALLVFLFIYILVYLPELKGVGNYWDWTTPYFQDQIKNYFLNSHLSWTDNGMGGALSYSSDYFFRFVVYLSSFLKINFEHILYALLVLLATFSSFGVWLTLSDKVKKNIFGYLISFAVVINPAYFYKVFAGHLNYLVSFLIFIWLIYFLIKKFQPGKITSAITLALLLAFVGVQIQFFIYSIIVIVLYFIFYKVKLPLKHVIHLLVIVLAINLPWLSNFIVGANSVSATSVSATGAMFDGSSYSSILRNLAMVFSNATVIQYIYSKLFFVLFLIVSLLLPAYFIFFSFYKIKISKEAKFYSVLWAIFLLLGTGFFLKVQIPFVSIFYPLFRESGHLAPLTGLFLLLGVAAFWGEGEETLIKKVKVPVTILVAVFIAINGFYFLKYLPQIDFSKIRETFSADKGFLDGQNDDGYRYLSYPFYNQYGLKTVENKVKNERLLNNSGWDSLINFSGVQSISNYADATNFNNLPQTRLLKTYDTNELEQMGVRYIIDFQGKYESNFDRYTNPSTYGNDLSLIKNNSNFLSKINSANPEGTQFVESNILELKNYYQKIYSPENEISYTKVNSSKYLVKLSDFAEGDRINFVERYNSGWRLYPLDSSAYNDSSIDCKRLSGKFNVERCSGEELSASPVGGNYYKPEVGSLDTMVFSPKLSGNQKDAYFVLYFQPQLTFDISVAVSIFCFLLSVGTLIYYKFRRRI